MEGARRYLNWKNQDRTWSYKDCKVTIIGMTDNRVRVVLRRRHYGYSEYANSDFSVNLMMGFVATDVKKATDNELEFTVQQSRDNHHRDLNDVNVKSESSQAINDLLDEIKQKQGNPPETLELIESDHGDEVFDEFVPVIYQPRIDAWKNFLREVHVHKHDSGNHEITLIFNDESLRRNWFLDFLYRIFRSQRYGRTTDIESFEERSGKFYFKDIYSGNDTLFDDSTHNRAEVAIKHYFMDKNHPVIFVNTSNHSLAPHDNNHDFWKWEYVTWDKDSPVKFGNKTREQLER